MGISLKPKFTDALDRGARRRQAPRSQPARKHQQAHASPHKVGAKLTDALGQPLDVASIVLFRMAFGAMMIWEVFRYFAADRIGRFYVEPTFFFSYFGFGWVQPWPGHGMYLHFAALGVLALCMTVGLFYRVSAALFFLGFTYVFLLDQANYLNHFYLISLVSLLMVFIPAHHAFSLDARWGFTRPSDTAPAWALWLLRAQVGLVYLFGGVAKLNSDWLQGEPVRGWLAPHAGLPVVGPWMGQEWLVWVFAYGGLFFDLAVTPALLWRRTRPWAFAAAVLFHLTNSVVFRIGIFPWFMIAATSLFFAPDWPRRWLRTPRQSTAGVARGGGEKPRSWTVSRKVLALLGTYLAVQSLVPLRHFLYPGNVNWTEEGHRFSWRMKLRDKVGEARFFVTAKDTGDTRAADPTRYLTAAQLDEMSTRPDMILQFAHHLAAEARRAGTLDVEVRAMVKVSLNGRAPQLLVDPSVNLSGEPRSLGAAPWIRPLTEPLRR